MLDLVNAKEQVSAISISNLSGNVSTWSNSCTFLLLSPRSALSAIQLQRNELKLSQRWSLFCARRKRLGGLQPLGALSEEHGRQIKLASPSLKSGSGRPCGWIRAGLFQLLRQTEAKCAPATFSLHYTVILSRIFRHGSCRNYPCPSWLLCMAILSFRWRGSRKSICSSLWNGNFKHKFRDTDLIFCIQIGTM